MADEPELNKIVDESLPSGKRSWLARLFTARHNRQAGSSDVQSSTQPLRQSAPEISAEQESPYKLIKQLSSWIDRGFSVNAIIDNLLRGLITTLHLDYAAYFVINPLDEKAQLKMQFTAKGLSPKVLTGFSLPINNESIIGWVYNQKHEHVLTDIRDSRFTNSEWLLPTTTYQAVYPIITNNQVIGFIDIQSHQPDLLDALTLDFLHSLSVYLRGIFVQAETQSGPSIPRENIGQVEHLVRQAQNDVELFSLLRSTLVESPFISVCFSVQYDHLSLQFITDAKRPAVSSAIQGLALPLENTLEQLASNNPILLNNLEKIESNGQILSFFTRRGCTSAAIFGIFENNAITYILAIGAFEDNPITIEKTSALLELTKTTGTTLGNLHLVSKLQSRLTELEALGIVSKAISVETNLQNLFLLLNDQIKALIGSDVSFAVTIYNQVQNKIEIPFMTEDGQIVNFPAFSLGEGLTSVVIRSQKPLLLHNQQQAVALGAKIIGKNAHSWMGVPLIIGSDVIGTMMVQDTEHEDRFTETDLNVFLTLAPQVAVAIRNAQLFNQVENSLSQHKLLHQITVETAAANTIDEAIQTTVNLLAKNLPGSKISVLLKDEHDILTIQYSTGFNLESVADLTIPVGQGIIGQVAQSGLSMIVNDVSTEPNYINLDPEIQSEMAVPITFKGEVLGVLDIELPEKNAFHSSEADILGTLGNNLGAVISSAHLLENVKIQVAQQQQLFEATSKIRRSVEMKSIMETSATEIGHILGARRVSIRINPQSSTEETAGLNSVLDRITEPDKALEVNE